MAEKRTSLATLRTGIAVLALPLTIVGLLIVLSTHYQTNQVLGLLIPMLLVCAGLLGLGVYLVVRGLRRIHRADALLIEIKKRHSFLAEFMD
ncbi:MAG: hypothetical protein PVG03_00880 [Desulfarculaceae bacterium]